MFLYIYKTNIQHPQKADELQALFQQFTPIKKVSFDLEDIDRIVKIESQSNLSEHDLIAAAKQVGICCEFLPE